MCECRVRGIFPKSRQFLLGKELSLNKVNRYICGYSSECTFNRLPHTHDADSHAIKDNYTEPIR